MSLHRFMALASSASLAVLAATALPAAAQTPSDVTTVDSLIISAGARATPATQETVTGEDISQTVNAINVEDTVKYLPSLIVRKRHIGDTQAPLATRTSGLGASARTLIFADGVLLSALIGNNNSTASPRWSMVYPEEIASVDFLYGPFSAAYAGNSIGGVLNIRTRTPQRLEGSIRAAGSMQRFAQYGTDDSYGAGQLSASIGDRRDNLWFRLSGNVVESNSQPLSYVTVARPGSTSASGTVVTGSFAEVNRTNSPIAVFGAGGLEHQLQTNVKLRVGYDLPFASAIYSIGRFGNATDSHVETYARDAAGQPVYSGTLNFDGRAYSVAASAFSNGTYSFDEGHIMQSLSMASRGDGPWTWNASASLYDYQKDVQRTPTTAIPGALVGGAGTILRMDGTGWRGLDASASRKIGDQALSFGAHDDKVELASSKYATPNWIDGAAGALTQQSLGQTRTSALWAQDALNVNDNVKVTIGGRYEDWKASNGFNFSSSPALSVHQPELSAGKVSPKASVTWASGSGWILSGSYGEAYRFPTVQELYQAITTGATLTVPNPTLRPEHARSGELAIEHPIDGGRVRLSLFDERITDALISQTAPLIPKSTTLFSYVQNIDRTHVRGVELVAELKDVLFKGFDLSGSATWTDPVVEKDAAFAAAVGKQVPGIPKFKATLVGTWRPTDRLSWTLAGRYSERLYASIDNSDVVTHTYQGFDPFFVVDTRVGYKIDAHWEAALGIDNLGDRRYFLFHPFPGRTAMAELNYKF